jgi:BirA family transcriptional regulator, biotin operon repressor / biotin---[acetyl-CoA-carboxylase] ligase
MYMSLEFERSGEDEEKLRELLNHRRLRRLIIRNLVWLTSVDSTQQYTKEELRSSTQGDLVISSVQTAGKGRENRTWFSQQGGLWMTVTLRPPRLQMLGEISQIATKAIVTTLEYFGLSGCSVKLPNDVQYQGRKIAGVLADASVTGPSSIVYLGIGINVNNDPSEISEISETSTSFKLVTGSLLDLHEFVTTLIENLDFEYDRFY